MANNHLAEHDRNVIPDTPAHRLAGDWGDDDPAVIDAYFQENTEGPTPEELPIEPGPKAVELPKVPKRLIARRFAVTLEQGPVMLLAKDERRTHLQVLNETGATIHAFIADNRTALSVIPGAGVVFPNAALIQSPNQYIELPDYDGALWVAIDPTAAGGSSANIYVIAVTS